MAIDNSSVSSLQPFINTAKINRLLGASKRIPAFDTARGLAIVGMFVAHMVALQSSFPQFLIGISHGRSAALFALLAGISLGIIAGGQRIPHGVKLLQTRMRVVIRALMLFVIVTLLSFYNAHIILILGYYASWFPFSLPFLGWKARNLLILASGLILLGIPLSAVMNILLHSFTLQTTTQDSALYVYLLSGSYGGAGFLAYIFIGLAWTRLGIAPHGEKARELAKKSLVAGTLLLILGTGTSATVDSWRVGRLSLSIFGITELTAVEKSSCNDSIQSLASRLTHSPRTAKAKQSSEEVNPADCHAYGAPAALDSLTTEYPARKNSPLNNSITTPPPGNSPFPGLKPEQFDLNFWNNVFLNPSPHSNSVLETLGNLGFSIITVSMFLLGGRRLALILLPLTTMGSMALTIYCLHVLWFAASNLAGWSSAWSALVMLVCFTIFSILWRLNLNRGPLERLLHDVSSRGTALSE